MTLVNINQRTVGIGISSASFGGFTDILNSATLWPAIAFTPSAAKTLNTVRLFVGTITGTLAAGDIGCYIFDSDGASGAPGTQLASSTTTSPSPITASSFNEWQGFSLALTAGHTYWTVWKNLNATPASNNPRFSMIPFIQFWQGGQSPVNGLYRGAITTDGLTWSQRGGYNYCVRYAYADGSFGGYPHEYQGLSTNTATKGVYGSRKYGIIFTSPSWGMNIVSVAQIVNTTGTPTGKVQMEIYNDTTQLGVSVNNYAPAFVPSNNTSCFFFDPPVYIPPNTPNIRIVMSETTNADAAGKYFYTTVSTADPDSNSTQFLPFGAITETWWDGAAWNLGLNQYPQMWLGLQPASEIVAAAGGSFVFGG